MNLSRLRLMVESRPGMWLVKCRACGNGTARTFDNPRAAHDYWRAHAACGEHADALSPENVARRRAMSAFVHAIDKGGPIPSEILDALAL